MDGISTVTESGVSNRFFLYFSAPMSHVIDYLPPNIPRILINRNVVHPPIARLLEGNDDEEEEEEEDLREGYIFDAYLLGFCDDVTRALVKEMTGSEENVEGKLLSCLKEDDELYNADDWSSVALPKDRVFLFPGASRGDDSSEYSYREIAHCDGCSGQISGMIRKCAQCFDYDLCEACYPKLSKSHHNGKHKFLTEPSSLAIETI
jgi:Zinc finger, ZZ type